MKNKKSFFLIILALSCGFSRLSRAEPAAEFDSVANAVLLVHEECSALHDSDSDLFTFPPNIDVTLEQCQEQNGNLCWAQDSAMGGRTSSEIICTHNQVVLGGLLGTYSPTQNPGSIGHLH
jgi:hypothetical protein